MHHLSLSSQCSLSPAQNSTTNPSTAATTAPPSPSSLATHSRPTELQLSKSAQRKHHAETDLERGIVLHRTPEIDALRVALQVAIRDQVDAVLLRRLQADDGEAEEERERFGEEGEAEAGDQAFCRPSVGLEGGG